MKWGIKQKYLDLLNNLFCNHKNILEVKIFGSRAKGDYKETSDIDLVITKSNPNITYTQLLSLKAEIYNLPILNKIDLVDYNSIGNLNFKKQIDQTSQVFFSTKE